MNKVYQKEQPGELGMSSPGNGKARLEKCRVTAYSQAHREAALAAALLLAMFLPMVKAIPRSGPFRCSALWQELYQKLSGRNRR